MRIISGKYKGLKLDGYNISGTRPTMDRVKESLFAMIQNNIKDKIVLDLFAGSGNLGLEAISNGAKKAYFVDNNNIAIKMIESNINKMHISDNYHLLKQDFNKALMYYHENKIKFDLIFLDPPYKEHFINDVLVKLNELDLLNSQALIVCEYDDEELESNIFKCIKEKKYGDKYVKIYKNED